METATTNPITTLDKPMDAPAPLPPRTDAPPKKRSSVRHTRAIQRDRTKRALSAPPAEAVVARLTEIVHPATLAQVSYFHGLGLRARLLTLPVMVPETRAPSLRACSRKFHEAMRLARSRDRRVEP